MLSRLGHGTVGRCNYEHRAVHLSRAGDHVLDVVGVSGAVNVSIVPAGGLVLYVSGINRNTSCLLLGCLVDFVISHFLSETLSCAIHSDSCGEGGLTVVNVSDGTNVDVRFSSFKFSLSHNR